MPEKRIEKSRLRKEYEQGFLISLVIIIIGVLLEWMTKGEGTGLPAWPLNAQVGVSFIIILLFIHFYYREMKTFKWLSRVPAAVSSISLFTLLVLIMGLTSQDNPDASNILKYTGISHVRNSYVFLLSGLFLLTSLGLVILRRATPFNFKNIGFLFNHMGLWIIVFAGSLGAGDMKRLSIYVNEGETVWYGYDDRQRPVEVPFMLKLIDFSMEEFNPKLAYVRSSDLSFPDDVKNNLRLIEEGKEIEVGGWNVEVTELQMTSRRDIAGYIFSADTTAIPAAKVKATNPVSGKSVSGWISCGSSLHPPEFLVLDEMHSLAMTFPEPKTYNSLIEISTKDGESFQSDLQVNKPVKISGWDLYQISYDTSKGKWSRLSVIEAIKDPWLVVVYIGIFMVLAGALYMFWLGKK